MTKKKVLKGEESPSYKHIGEEYLNNPRPMTKSIKKEKKIICPTCNGLGYEYLNTRGYYGCDSCKGKGMIIPGEPWKRIKSSWGKEK